MSTEHVDIAPGSSLDERSVWSTELVPAGASTQVALSTHATVHACIDAGCKCDAQALFGRAPQCRHLDLDFNVANMLGRLQSFLLVPYVLPLTPSLTSRPPSPSYSISASSLFACPISLFWCFQRCGVCCLFISRLPRTGLVPAVSLLLSRSDTELPQPHVCACP